MLNIHNNYPNSTKSITHQLYAVVRSNISLLIEEVYPSLLATNPKEAIKIKKFIDEKATNYINENEENPLKTSYKDHEKFLMRVHRRVKKV